MSVCYNSFSLESSLVAVPGLQRVKNIMLFLPGLKDSLHHTPCLLNPCLTLPLESLFMILEGNKVEKNHTAYARTTVFWARVVSAL